jgi:hypothetical protein
MPPEETPAPEVSQPAPDSQSPAVEVPASEPAQIAPEPTPATAEVAPAPETAQSSIPTAQIPPNEPLVPEPEPIETTPPPSPSATDGHSEPPSAAASTPTPAHPIRDFLNKARVAIQDRKRKKRDKIMQALNTKTPATLKLRRAGEITNDEVEKLLHVSDATATRYLSALEREGKIRQVGKTGMGVAYQKI